MLLQSSEKACCANWMPVLMYHRVVRQRRPPDPYNCQITTDNFESQLKYLQRNGYQSIALDDVPLTVSGSARWSKPVAITFDDGYSDFCSHAYPLLQKYGMTATIMLVSEQIGGRNVWDSNAADLPPLLSLDQIRDLQRSGITFGAHTATHPSLPDISIEEAACEIEGSKKRLEQLLEQPVCTLAYPYGRCTPEICHAAKQTGFAAAFAVQPAEHTMYSFSRIDSAAFAGASLLWRLHVQGRHFRVKHSRAGGMVSRLRRMHGWCSAADCEITSDAPTARAAIS